MCFIRGQDRNVRERRRSSSRYFKLSHILIKLMAVRPVARPGKNEGSEIRRGGQFAIKVLFCVVTRCGGA